jgi:phosphohistidine swiveling domain-containing protein
MTTIGQTITGTASITGQFNIDNVRIDGNTISATTGGITLSPAGSNNVTVNGDLQADRLQSNDMLVINNIDVDKIRSYNSNADITIEPQGTGQIAMNSAVKFNVGYIEAINTLTSGSTITVDCATSSVKKVTLTASTGFVITSLPTGGTVTLIITQDGTGARTATFGTDTSTAVKFPGGTPTLTGSPGSIDIVTVFNDGTNYLGNIIKNYT